MKHARRIAAILVLLALILGGRYTPGTTTQTEFLMDTIMTVTAYGRHGKAAVSAVFKRFHELDAMLNVHNPQSDLARLNAAPAGEPIPVSRELCVLLQNALSFSKRSGGAFDCTLLAVSDVWGFGTDHAAVPSATALRAALAETGPDTVLADEASCTVTKTKSGMRLDLGGAAKGYAADEALRILREHNVQSAYLDLGGNVAVMGGKPLSVWQSLIKGRKTRPFTIGLQKPDAPRGEVIDTVTLSDGFVVTSGDYERYFEADGTRYHHILDPKTGKPARTGLKSVTVVTQNGTQADMLSTALFVLGKDGAEPLFDLCERVIMIDETMTPIQMKG